SPPATDEEPPAPAPELARTGTDGSALSGLFASAAAAIAAGAGLLLFGRRRARA
ncbi:LPXTG cell wall anchor domain-containing protein, partial [Nocardiopsis dassonvillei]|nr:LPXTG cell wall anchor domain-containing protein [Nocardiopsis dassonvillei]